eukprot:101693_1
MATATNFRKELLRKDKLELVKILKKKKQPTNGGKSDLVDRILAYDEKHGGKMGKKEAAKSVSPSPSGEEEEEYESEYEEEEESEEEEEEEEEEEGQRIPVVFPSKESLIIGDGKDNVIFIDDALNYGFSSSCKTFKSPSLVIEKDGQFQISQVEVW